MHCDIMSYPPGTLHGIGNYQPTVSTHLVHLININYWDIDIFGAISVHYNSSRIVRNIVCMHVLCM